MNKLQDFQKLVINNARNVQGMKVGDKAPNFELPNATGRAVSLYECLKSGPVILKFYRGEWCPICNLDLKEIQQYLNQFEKFKAQVIAISPQKPNDSLTIIQKNELGFEVLSDSDQKVINNNNLQFDPGEDYHQRRDLSVLNGDGSITLPVPATFIIATDLTIIGAHVEANYTERMAPKEILKILESKLNI
ncbi:MAG: peroxiredoxin family protein [Flavobacteriaceae bacterium]